MAGGARDEERRGKRQQEAHDGGSQGHGEGAPKDGEIEGIEEAPVAFSSPRQLKAAIDATGQEAVSQHDDERRGKQHRHGEPRGQEEPGAQLHGKVISSAALQQN